MMYIHGFNVTEICERKRTNPENLTDNEFDFVLDGYCDPPGSTSSKPSIMGYVVYYFFLIFCGFSLNLLVVVTILSRNRLQTIPNAFMVSLSVADILLATGAIPLRLMDRLNQNSNYDITPFLYPCIGVASIFSLCAVTFDRYMHIRYPLNYDIHMDKRRAIWMIAGLWIFSILQALVFFLVRENRHIEAIYNDVRLGYCFVIPCVFISFVYTKLFKIAKSHVRVIVTTSATILNEPWCQKKDIKIFKVIALIVGTFVLCWLPFFVAVSYELHFENPRSQNFYLFMGIAECFACSTCVLNPIIYGLLRRDLRISMRYVVACKRVNIEESNYI